MEMSANSMPMAPGGRANSVGVSQAYRSRFVAQHPKVYTGAKSGFEIDIEGVPATP